MAENLHLVSDFKLPITLEQVIKVLNKIMSDDDKVYLAGITEHGGSFELDIPGCRFTFVGLTRDGEPVGKVSIGVKYYSTPCQEYHFVTPVAVRGGSRSRSAQSSTDNLTGTQS